ncbi:nucleoside triphosphate pyrophosphatase [Corynebacterium sp.]|uniref:Maf family protein n=1 Tax=Corynebacterium sp. TaxID=1720 RepID=UPI0026DA7938|nr:nucleoside triphosphate pyrophosphatase [Corynebacterium sp.]MDO5077178.1 nucleoside triphosphate pyrophosphatase [Corynebacterium sp.]
MRIVLASASPSRLAILRGAGVEPVVHPADVDEARLLESMGDAGAAEKILALSQAKAETVAASYPNDVVIGCDSMLLLPGELQGKPLTVEATIERWKQQSGSRAELVTGHCIIAPGGNERVLEAATTGVVFAEVSDADIEAYANSGEPLHCAGAFTLEALGGWFIDRIEGDPSNVIGLSLPLVRRALYQFGHNVSDCWIR